MPFFRIDPTALDEFSSGSRSGSREVVVGVGTATMRKVQEESRESQAGVFEFLGRDLAGVVLARLQFLDSRGLDVEPNHIEMLGQRRCERHAYVAQADDPDSFRAHSVLLSKVGGFIGNGAGHANEIRLRRPASTSRKTSGAGRS
jgi:hypothetical protein